MIDWAGGLHALPCVEASCATESNAEEDGGTLIRGIEPVASVNYNVVSSCNIVGIGL
jgi:hypothetical protein